MIADKSPVVRSGLRDFISRDGRFEVLDAHASGSAFIAAVEEQPTDIGIIGWSLPDMNGGEILATLKRRHIADAHHRLHGRARQRRAAPSGSARRVGFHLQER